MNKSKMKGFFAVIICLVFLMNTLSVNTAFISVGKIVASAEELADVAYLDESGQEQTVNTYTVVEADIDGNVTLATGFNVVNSNVTAVNLVSAPTGGASIILCDSCTFTTAGLAGTVSIYGQAAGSGKLISDGSATSVTGISGTVTINGGMITATGGGTKAGISGTVVINDGSVTATGGASGGAGIGGKGGSGGTNYGETANVTINGGTVTATGGRWNPGIGNGYSCAYMSGSVTINGGEVHATGGAYAAGIGTGQYGRGMNITINGGEVHAQGGSLGDGIGNGQAQAGQYYDDKLGTVIINGGNVDARGGQYGICGTNVTLNWTNLTDTIYAGSYHYTSSLNIQKDFIKQGTHTLVTAANLGNYTTICAYDGPYAYASFEDYDGSALTNPSAADFATQKLAAGGLVTRPADPQRSGLTFAGWFNNGTAFDFDTAVNTDITLTAHWTSDTAISYLDEDGITQTTTAYMPLSATANALTLKGGWYAVTSDIEISQRITINGDVHIILADGCTLTAPKGIEVEAMNFVSFYGQTAGTGKLVSMNPDAGNAAVGSNAYYTNAGSMTFNGGTFSLRGGMNGAAIGGGRSSGFSSITINGGNITAKGNPATTSNTAAGIGAGLDGDYGIITINGGTVNATSAGNAAAIGGAQNSTGITVNINGGNITANKSSAAYSHGIGGSHNGNGIIVNLNWTDYNNDSILASDFKASNFNFLKDFNLQGTGTKATAENMNGVTIIPRIGYDVHFVDADGITEIYAPVNVSTGYTVDRPADPIRPCNAFVSWRLNGVDYDFSTPVTSEITLRAHRIDYGTQSYIDENGDTQTCSDYTVLTTTSSPTLTDGWYAAPADLLYNQRFECDGEVNIILVDGVNFDLPRGITVEDDNILNIYGQSAMSGTLNISYPEDYHAGIGVSVTDDAGYININGGTLNINGGDAESAIGGGLEGDICFNGGIITTDTCAGASMLAPNGDGYTINLSWHNPTDSYSIGWYYKGTIIFEKDFFYSGYGVSARFVDETDLYNKTIVPARDFLEYYDEFGNRMACTSYTVLEDSDSAIVRMQTSGWYAVTDDTTINNRLSVAGRDTKLILCDYTTLTVKDMRLSSADCVCTIYGQEMNNGVLDATGRNTGKSSGYAGIGTTGGTVNIFGGDITAEGASNAAGIGGGTNLTDTGTINIARATVTATGGNNAAGIGGGYISSSSAGSKSGTITIDSGVVTATGGSGAAGIGSAYNCTVANDNFNVTINGGTVTATGGSRYTSQQGIQVLSAAGAGIGGGAVSSNTTCSGTIYINGGNITANGVSTSGGTKLSDGMGCGTNMLRKTGFAISLNWTSYSDSIYASSYTTGGVSLMRTFRLSGSYTQATASNINGVTILPFIAGDVNEDTELNSMDYAMLRAYVYCEADTPSDALDKFDYIDDDIIDGYDVVLLELFINGTYNLDGTPV